MCRVGNVQVWLGKIEIFRTKRSQRRSREMKHKPGVFSERQGDWRGGGGEDQAVYQNALDAIEPASKES
jgi:hypothetical protein